MSIIQANASVTHTFGNVACVAMDYVKHYFTEDYFKVTHISTKMAYRQLDIFRSKFEFWKLHKPMLVLRPRIELDDSSKYFYGSAMMNRMFNVRSPMEFSNMTEMLLDKRRGVNINFLWNRMKIYYDVVLVFESMNEQLNVANYLQNMIVPNTPWFIPAALESYVPRNIVYMMADYLKVPRENTADILSYLNTEGKTPFTYKFKDGSGNNEFFSLYNTNIEAIASDLSIDDGDTRGMISDTFTISFTLSMEFNAMGCFYLFLRDGDERLRLCPHDDIKSDGRVETLFTIPLLYDLHLEPGWKMFRAPSYTVNDAQEEDIVELNPIMSRELKSLLHYQQKMHLDQGTFVRFKVYKDRTELVEGKDFLVDTSDVDNITLHTFDCNGDKTYRLFVIVNNAMINSIQAELAEFNKEK